MGNEVAGAGRNRDRLSPTAGEVEAFLANRHGEATEGLEALSGGFWSSAYGYRLGADELVVRFGPIRSGFEDDRRAMAYASPELPVPDVLEIGDAFGGGYAISRRHHGRFLEDIEPHESESAAPMLQRLLGALREAPRADGERDGSWRAWLRDSMKDEDVAFPNHGWRRKLEAQTESEAVFRRVEARVLDLVDGIPERAEFVHGDLLHRNVLVAPDASRVTAVFSWKCSMRGDSLYDAAWCTFWGGIDHPGIAALEAFSLMDDGSPDAALRHHCYQLHIGASHLGWYAWTGDADALERLTQHTASLLDSGY
jgi:aminoglycoside phosphotransferase (APT) family kinase protein